jgi:folate-dependent phosphoribosylglycinamide formyltransferase PurN
MLTKSKKAYWIAMLSRTGYELSEIINNIEIIPDKIILNKPFSTDTISEQLVNIVKDVEIVSVKNTPEADIYRQNFYNPTDRPTVITLHGWMRVIPPEICEEYNIYNGHPGLITKFPELKGKDPQKRAFEAKHDEIGTVIHKVIPEVDEGEVLGIASIENTYDDEQSLSDIIREMSILLWGDFLKGKLND